jgi:hypothetical protein
MVGHDTGVCQPAINICHDNAAYEPTKVSASDKGFYSTSQADAGQGPLTVLPLQGRLARLFTIRQ